MMLRRFVAMQPYVVVRAADSRCRHAVTAYY